MKFNSKTAILEHIKELEESGYLEPQWHLNHSTDPPYETYGVKLYKIKFVDIGKNSINDLVVGPEESSK